MADVDVPKLGKVNKKVVVGIAVAAGAYVAYRYYQSRNAAADTSTDPGYEDPGVLPGVAGAIKPDGRYGSGDTTQTSDTTQFTTNAQWSQFALEKLSQSDTWTYAQIAEALGNYLNDRPLSDLQKSIVTAALGVAGHEPVGSHSIISGGNVDVTVAPTGVAATATATSALINFVAVPGARTYNVYRSDSTAAAGTAASSPITLSGLTPGTAYTVSVAAVSSAGAVGPKSSPISFKTPAVAVGTPAKPVVSSIVGARVTLTTSKVPYATVYRWFLNGKIYNTTDGPAVTLTNLNSKARYSPGVSVQADTSTGKPGALSRATSFTTK